MFFVKPYLIHKHPAEFTFNKLLLSQYDDANAFFKDMYYHLTDKQYIILLNNLNIDNIQCFIYILYEEFYPLHLKHPELTLTKLLTQAIKLANSIIICNGDIRFDKYIKPSDDPEEVEW